MATFNNELKSDGWGSWVGKNIFGIGQDANAYNIGSWFRNNYNTNNPYINSLSNTDSGYIIEQFYIENPDWHGAFLVINIF